MTTATKTRAERELDLDDLEIEVGRVMAALGHMLNTARAAGAAKLWERAVFWKADLEAVERRLEGRQRG